MNTSTNSAATKTVKPPRENMLTNILLNILIPTVILTKGSQEAYLGPTWGLVVALMFPLAYGVYDYQRVKKINFFSALGLFSILLTGGMSLLKLPPEYIAIKEAAIPGLIGLATWISVYTPFPLIRTFLFNENILQVEKVTQALKHFQTEAAFEKSLKNATFILASSFFLSSFLNYCLATWLLKSPPGTEAYNAELGRMTLLSYPVIMLPSMLVFAFALYYLFQSITRLTHLKWDEILQQPDPPTPPSP
jgi:intracellular septation protein A